MHNIYVHSVYFQVENQPVVCDLKPEAGPGSKADQDRPSTPEPGRLTAGFAAHEDRPCTTDPGSLSTGVCQAFSN